MSMAGTGADRADSSACGDGNRCLSIPGGGLIRLLRDGDLNDDIRRMNLDLRESFLSSEFGPISPVDPFLLLQSSTCDRKEARLSERETVVSVPGREKLLLRSSVALSDSTCSDACVSKESCRTIRGLR